MFLDQPGHASPYSPSDRLLLNVLNIDIEAIPELTAANNAQQIMVSEAFQEELKACRSADRVAYEAVARLKLPLLRLLFTAFEEHSEPARAEAFEAFRRERSTLLDRACLFQALRDYFSSQDPALANCALWPAAFRYAHSPDLDEFRQTHAALIRFHLWLQWIADSQLAAAAKAAKSMAIGLYRDLAVGASSEGAEVWSHPESLVAAATVGAPPDILNPAGQDWGLPPLHPQIAREHGYTTFIDLVRANMRHAGGLRIDHAMALQRVYWIPKNGSPRDGAYVSYPTDDLVGILALESQRNQCLVVGEDLGTVPEGFRERMAEANILSYRVLFFERDEEGFVPPEEYPRLSLGVAGNHDLPTLLGWWEGADIEAKQRQGLYPDGPEEARQERKDDREAFLEALRREGLQAETSSPGTTQLCEAAHAFLAKTPCLLTLIQLDDIIGEREQVNFPSAPGRDLNWNRRLSSTLEELAGDDRLQQLASAMSRDSHPSSASTGKV